MIHILTVHWQDDNWIDVQLAYLNKHILEPFRVYAFLNGITEEHRKKFFYSSTEPIKEHAIKLNILADIASLNSSEDDLLIFIDGDAFPVGDIISFGREKLQRYPLIAIQRLENYRDIQPHPSFCLTTVGFWKSIAGDWKEGYKWVNSEGRSVTDVGGNLLGMLVEKGIEWYPVLRSNKVNLHPVLFGLYEELIYHHGCGFRGAWTRADRGLGEVSEWISIEQKNRALSRKIFETIKNDHEFYKTFMKSEPSEKKTKKCLIVLGMHRSETSALMGILQALGIETGGSSFFSPSAFNQKGFFELVDVFKINNSILKSLNSSWDSLNPFPENWQKQCEAEGYPDEIRRVIESNFSGVGLMAIKDPRLCRLLPLWAEAFESLGIETYFIIPLRNPVEIALSLKTRNGFSLEKSLLLWMTYMLEGEYYSRKYPRVFTTFNDLLNNPHGTIENISKKLNVRFTKDYADIKDEVSQFLDSGLKHHIEAEFPSVEALSREIFHFYNLLLSLVGTKGTEENSLFEIDSIREHHFGLRRFFYNRDIIDQFGKFEGVLAEKERALSCAVAEKEAAIAEKDRIAAEKTRLEKKFAGFERISAPKKLERAFRKQVIYPIKDRLYPSPKIFANSIAKSGTNLLTRVLSNMGFNDTITVLGDVQIWMEIEKIEPKVIKLKNGDFLTGHRHFDDNFNDILRKNKISQVLIVRDPRDVTVSKTFYILKKTDYHLSAYFSSLSERERFLASINGVKAPKGLPDLPGIGEIYRSYLPWLKQKGCLVIRFEDLVGNSGGGNDEKQFQTLIRISKHLGISFNEKRLRKIAEKSFNKNSPTFRKGQIGDWKNWLDDEMLRLFKNEEYIFKEYGYLI